MRKFRLQSSLSFGVALGVVGMVVIVFSVQPGLWSDSLAVAVAALAAAAAVAFAVVAHARSSVTVGAEGLEVRQLRSRRFIGYDQLSYVRTYSEGSGNYRTEGVTIVLTSGEEVRLELQAKEALIAAIREAQRAFEDEQEQLEMVELDPQQLARGGRRPRRWLQELRALSQPAAGYRQRQQVVHRGDLWKVVRNPSAKAEERAAAAMALTPIERRADRERLRILAHDTSDEQLRVALDLAAEHEPDERALAEALAAAAEEPERRTRE